MDEKFLKAVNTLINSENKLHDFKEKFNIFKSVIPFNIRGAVEKSNKMKEQQAILNLMCANNTTYQENFYKALKELADECSVPVWDASYTVFGFIKAVAEMLKFVNDNWPPNLNIKFSKSNLEELIYQLEDGIETKAIPLSLIVACIKYIFVIKFDALNLNEGLYILRSISVEMIKNIVYTKSLV